MIRSSVDLPQPEGPISETNSPAADGQVDAGHGLHRARALAEALADALERDRRRRGHVASSCVW